MCYCGAWCPFGAIEQWFSVANRHYSHNITVDSYVPHVLLYKQCASTREQFIFALGMVRYYSCFFPSA